MNKLSLVGMQLPQKYKENFDVSSELRPFVRLVTADEEPSLETSKFSLYFSGSRINTNESLFILKLMSQTRKQVSIAMAK